MANKPLPMLLLLLLCSATAFSQRQNLASSMPFFREKAEEYQHWLTAKGFDKVLSVERVRLKVTKEKTTDSTELELLLSFTSPDPDTAIARWNRLKKDYDTPGDSLEAYLYRIFVHFMEIPDTQGNIQIYVHDNVGNYVKGTYIWIWKKDGNIITKKVAGTTRAKWFDLTIPYPVSATGKGKSSNIATAKVTSANAVFNKILLFVKTNMLEQHRYRDELNDRRPHLENDSVRTATTLKFTAADLGKEVITDQSRWPIEKWFGINTIAMERLTFYFEYLPAPDKKSYTLKCTIDGKFGSGVFKPRTTGYMNMEPDYEDFFEAYKNNFRLTLEQYLKQ